MNSMSTASGQTACTPTNYVQTSLIDILKKSNLQKYSDLYIITDQLYGFDSTTGVYSNETLFNLIDSKKPRINILLYTKSCPSNFVDSSKPEIQSYLLLTQKSGGAFVATGDPTEVVNWFKMGEQYETSSYDIIYQEDQNKEVSGALLSRSGFHLKQNTNYTIWGTLVHVDSNKFKPSFSLYSSTGTKLPQPITNTIGDQFSASFGVSVPSDDIYTIEFNTDRIPSMEYQIRVLQYNPTFGFDLSFISNTSVQTSPEYGDSLQINCLAQKFNQTNDAIMPETIEIFDSTYKLVFNDTFRAGTGIGQFLSNNKWQCVNVDQVYYIRIDTQDESRTFSVTCLQSGAGNPTGVCLHGGTELTDKTCLCPVGWSGVICGQIDCMNNATLVGSVCNCQTDYTGQFCEHALGKCSNDDLQYNTEVTTFTLVVDLQSSLLDDVQSIGRNPNNLPQLSEYILVTYDGSNNESSNAGIFKTSSLAIFAATITNLVKLTTASIPQTNYYDYLAKGLNLQTGSRSVLLWVPDLVDCTNEPASMSASIINLIQKKSADVRYLSRANNLECSTFANVVLSGNGMITDVTLDASDLSDYVFFNLLTQNPTYLIVMDSNYYSTSAECSNDVIIEFPVNNDETYYITLLGYEKGDMTLNPNGESATPITSNILSFTIDSKVINKLTLKGKSSINKCGYTIETSSLTRITYTYKSLAFSGEKEYAPLTNSPSTTVYFNIEGKSGLVSDLLQKFPLVSLVEASNSQNIPVQRQDNCNYKWSFTFKCDNKNAASHYTYKIKGVGGDYQKTISVDCLTMGKSIIDVT
uniref:EGF-like domain-containing protein n=1 Tax=Rhabditophanes sp. KR3021 TaxID=114890 RepID=A0AC35U635_9BILA